MFDVHQIKLNHIQKAIKENNIRNVVVSTRYRTMLNHYFSEDRIKKGKAGLAGANLMNIYMDLKLIRNQNYDKIRIISTPNAHKNEGMYLVYENIEKRTGINRRIIQKRAEILTGISLAALMDNSTYELYIGREYKRNMTHFMSNKIIRESIPEAVLNDAQNKMNSKQHGLPFAVEVIFKYLWYNDSTDFTGHNNDIRKFTLTNQLL